MSLVHFKLNSTSTSYGREQLTLTVRQETSYHPSPSYVLTTPVGASGLTCLREPEVRTPEATGGATGTSQSRCPIDVSSTRAPLFYPFCHLSLVAAYESSLTPPQDLSLMTRSLYGQCWEVFWFCFGRCVCVCVCVRDPKPWSVCFYYSNTSSLHSPSPPWSCSSPLSPS